MKRSMVLILVGAACSSPAQVVYSNMTGMNLFEGTLSSGFSVSPEEGDQLLLGSGGRTITDVQSLIRGVYDAGNTNTFDYDITMRLRALVGGVPATILYSSTVQVRNQAEGVNVMDWSIPNIVVPDTVVLTFSYVREGGNTGSVGEDFGGTPSIGYSDPNFYWTTGFGSTFFENNFPVNGHANMAAQLTASPEPGSLALLGLGIVGICRRRLQTRHKSIRS